MEIVIKGKRKKISRDRGNSGLVRLDGEALDLLEDKINKTTVETSVKKLASAIIIQAVEQLVIREEVEE